MNTINNMLKMTDHLLDMDNISEDVYKPLHAYYTIMVVMIQWKLPIHNNTRLWRINEVLVMNVLYY